MTEPFFTAVPHRVPFTGEDAGSAVGFKAYNLDQVLDGALDDVIDALARADTEALLAGL